MTGFRKPGSGLSRLSTAGGGTALKGVAAEVLKVTASGSGTWTVPDDGVYQIDLIGGGAGGARATSGQPAGGGGGGFSRITRLLSEGDVFSYTVGGGGVGSTGTTSGNAGGASSFQTVSSAVDITLLANGGGNPSGGLASGGDINVGGRGGLGFLNAGGAAGSPYLSGVAGGGGGGSGDNGYSDAPTSGLHYGDGGGGSARSSASSSAAGRGGVLVITRIS